MAWIGADRSVGSHMIRDGNNYQYLGTHCFAYLRKLE